MAENRHYTRSKLKSLKPDEVVDIALRLQDKLSETLDKIANELVDLSSKFDQKFKLIEDQLKITQSDLELVKNSNFLLEKRCNRLEQYSRRECLEIKGIPANIEHKDLIPSLNPVFELLKVDVDKKEIQACHRVSAKSNDVIIKFTNRQTRNSIYENRKCLKNIDLSNIDFPASTRLFINESLTRTNKRLLGIANRLHKKGELSSFWTANGMLRIKIKQDEQFIAIEHEKDFLRNFKNLDLNSIFQ